MVGSAHPTGSLKHAFYTEQPLPFFLHRFIMTQSRAGVGVWTEGSLVESNAMWWRRSKSGSDGQYAQILIQVREVKQLFNSLDPTPFPDRDLDKNAEEFIIGWANEHPSHLPLRLEIKLREPLDANVDVESVGEAVRHYFAYRADVLGRQLRQLLSVGRGSLLVGLSILCISFLVAQWLAGQHQSAWMNILQESLIIGGWVAMWRPLQIFLYDWWPIQQHRSLCQRLAKADVQIVAPEANQNTEGR